MTTACNVIFEKRIAACLCRELERAEGKRTAVILDDAHHPLQYRHV